LNARERVLRGITMTGPDRAPINHYIFPGAFYRHGEALLRVAQQYPDDFGNASVNVPAQVEDASASMEIIEWRDAWGTLWRRLKGYTSGDVREPAIPTWDAWSDYRMPPPPSPEHWAEMKQRFDAQRPEFFLRAGGGSLFQLMQHLRGPADLLMDLAEDRPEVHELADAIIEHHLHAIRGGLAAGADCITFGDDWGAQDRLLVRPPTWRRFFKPRYKRMFDVIKDAGALVWFHSDGWILEIIPDLIEIGVDVLNPQHYIMGDERVAAVAAGRVCIRTDIDRQWLIPQGSPEEIRDYVKKVLRLFGNYNGGIMLHGEIGPDVPLENVRALYAAFYEYGRYPFDWL
jgi:uroporphyrinogen decarboxylase